MSVLTRVNNDTLGSIRLGLAQLAFIYSVDPSVSSSGVI